MLPPAPRPRWLRRALGALAALAGAVLLIAPPAGAHTGFESSDPADGTTTREPVAEITLRFSGPASPAGTGFEVLDPSGAVRTPDSVTSPDPTTWVLSFAEPLAGGTVGVRWMVQAPDAHPIDGAFSFTTPDIDAGVGSAPPGADALPTDEASGLEAFLAADGNRSTQIGERIAAVGRIVGIGGTLVAIGALAFATFVLRSGPGDLRHVLFWVRRAAAIVVLGAGVRLVGRVLIDATGDWSALVDPWAVIDSAGSTTGLAVVLRFLGGIALLVGCKVQLAHASPSRDPIARVQHLMTVGAAPTISSEDLCEGDWQRPPPGEARWEPGAGGAACVVGVVALLAGYLFDGHTVTEGTRATTAVIDVIHVLAAAVWVGGLAMLVAVLRRRHRRGQDVRALHLAARFSVVAAASLVAVGASGLALAVIVLDAPSALWTTPWGQLLIAKTLLVTVAAGLGGYNHRVLLPALEASPHSVQLSDRFRRVVGIEATVLFAVVAVTAFLVGAAS